MDFPKALLEKLQQRQKQNALRTLRPPNILVDFSSNDYLGFARSQSIVRNAGALLTSDNLNGATGSRLISGNHPLFDLAELQIAGFHQRESALIFNSGYDANVGLFSSVPQRHDIILYDELSHASIRDGISLSQARAFKFRHNDLSHLEDLLQKHRASAQETYIATESVFSMDGDSPDLDEMARIANKYNARLIVDEAHAIGVFHSGLATSRDVFATVITFGKAMGSHGAAVLGSQDLRSYLINFARSFIYTTALPPHSIAMIIAAYRELKSASEPEILQTKIALFKESAAAFGLHFIESNSAIQCLIVPGNDRVKALSKKLQTAGFDVRPILSPTVPAGAERLRICLHAFNSDEEIRSLVEAISRAFA